MSPVSPSDVVIRIQLAMARFSAGLRRAGAALTRFAARAGVAMMAANRAIRMGMVGAFTAAAAAARGVTGALVNAGRSAVGFANRVQQGWDRVTKVLISTAIALDRIGLLMKNFGRNAALIGGIGVAGLKKFSDYAATIEEKFSQAGFVFKGVTQEALAFARVFSTKVERSMLSVIPIMTDIQNLALTTFDPKQAVDFTKKLTQIAFDVGSRAEIAPEKIAQKLIAAIFGGQAQAGRSVGVDITQKNLERIFSQIGLKNAKGEALTYNDEAINEQIKRLGRFYAVIEALGKQDVFHDLQATLESFANLRASAWDQLRELAYFLGTELNVMLGPVVKRVRAFATAFVSFLKLNPNVVKWILLLPPALLAGGIAIFALGSAISVLAVIVTTSISAIGVAVLALMSVVSNLPALIATGLVALAAKSAITRYGSKVRGAGASVVADVKDADFRVIKNKFVALVDFIQERLAQGDYGAIFEQTKLFAITTALDLFGDTIARVSYAFDMLAHKIRTGEWLSDVGGAAGGAYKGYVNRSDRRIGDWAARKEAEARRNSSFKDGGPWASFYKYLKLWAHSSAGSATYEPWKKGGAPGAGGSGPPPVKSIEQRLAEQRRLMQNMNAEFVQRLMASKQLAEVEKQQKARLAKLEEDKLKRAEAIKIAEYKKSERIRQAQEARRKYMEQFQTKRLGSVDVIRGSLSAYLTNRQLGLGGTVEIDEAIEENTGLIAENTKVAADEMKKLYTLTLQRAEAKLK